MLIMRHYALRHSRVISIKSVSLAFFLCRAQHRGKVQAGQANMLVVALSRRHDYDLTHVKTFSSSILDLICKPYVRDNRCVALLLALGSEAITKSDLELSARLLARLHRYFIDRGLS